MIYGEEKSLLEKVFKGRRVIEIGGYKGYSTNIIGAVAKNVLSVDTFQSDNIPGMHQGESTFMEYLKNKPDNADYIKGNSQDIHTQALVPFDAYDALFIDGDHSYRGAWLDLCNYTPFLKQGERVIAMHDFGNPQFTGVMAAAMNFFNRLPDEHVGGLAVWYRY